MENTIELFMWGYQRHMQISLQVSAETLFNQIDLKLRPTLFLLGILMDERTDRHPICLEPEISKYSVDAFSGIKQLATELNRVDDEEQIPHSQPGFLQNHTNRISNKALMEAVLKTLKDVDVYSDTEKFISSPVYVEGFLVFPVLELKKEVLSKYYCLTKNICNKRSKMSRSFIESAIDIFLRECSSALKHSNVFTSGRSSEELLIESAQQFMYSIALAGDNMDGFHGLYEACNTIASLKYEGEEGLGKMVIAKKNHPNIRLTLQLKEPIMIRDFRKVRKFLELSDDTSLIISDAAYIYGLGEVTGKYHPTEESLFIINFISHYHWEVSHATNVLMAVKYRHPYVPKELIDREKFYSDFKTVFVGINNIQLDNLWDITIQATMQKHGTMLVITDNAAGEALRLGKQSFALEPINVSPIIIPQITSIDGSVLLDRDCVCHAIGVILDGLATDKGDSSRGARYNSAVRYYEHFGRQHSTIIIIVSEDGMINLIPDLKPEINHSLVTESIQELVELSKLNAPDRVSLNNLLNFFEQVKFYLTLEECKIINQLRKQLEQTLKNEGGMKINRTDLTPNSE